MNNLIKYFFVVLLCAFGAFLLTPLLVAVIDGTLWVLGSQLTEIPWEIGRVAASVAIGFLGFCVIALAVSLLD